MAEANNQKHFVLVHGLSHGAWCWYKLKPLLEEAGHRVTELDLAASGSNRKAIQDVHTLHEYTEPLLDILASLPDNEKVILVGHSFGGLSLALASDRFPQKISAAVFLAAFMPDTEHKRSYVLDELMESFPAETHLLDTQFAPYDNSNPSGPKSVLFGHKLLTSKLYQLSPIEDLDLAKLRTRPGSLFLDDLSKPNKFTNEGYGQVDKFFIICEKDELIPKKFQERMIENYTVKEAMEIKGADHMAMFSKPKELRDCLFEIARNVLD